MLNENFDWARRVERYYDETTDLYIASTGPVLQAGLLVADGRVLPPAESCVEFARRAGIADGSYILDAGCGVAAPAVAIAEAFTDVRIRAVTLSSHQVSLANKMIVDHALSSRITVEQADFHSLNSANAEFDAVMFLESFGHSYDFEILCAEMSRVLIPGGFLYIKDVFVDNPSTAVEEGDLDAFNRQFLYRTPSISELVVALTNAGFDILRAGSIEPIISYATFKDSVYRLVDGNPVLTRFGEKHNAIFTNLPVYFGEILAQRHPRPFSQPVVIGVP